MKPYTANRSCDPGACRHQRNATITPNVAEPSNKSFSYHHQWWVTHNEHGAYLALGYGGQIIYFDPTAQLVVAKFSSYPTPTAGGVEFFHTLSAINALAKVLAQ